MKVARGTRRRAGRDRGNCRASCPRSAPARPPSWSASCSRCCSASRWIARHRGRGTHSIGRSRRPRTLGDAPRTSAGPAAARRQPWTRGWLARTCSISVVPDRGRPKMKTGRRVSRPIPAVRAKNPASNARSRPSTCSACSAGSYSRESARRLQGQGVGLAQAVGGAGVRRRAHRGRAPGRTAAGRGGRVPGRGSASRSSSAARSASGSLSRSSVASRAWGWADVGCSRSAARKAASASASRPDLGMDAPQVELSRGRVGLQPGGLRSAACASGSRPSSWSAQPSPMCVAAFSVGPRPARAPSTGSPRRARPARPAARRVAPSPTAPSAPARRPARTTGRASSSWPSRLRVIPMWRWVAARPGSSRSASR